METKTNADIPKEDGAHSFRANFVEKLPQWFAIFAALVYSTGFLIEFTFFDTLGVRGAANDIFKARYIHAGVLFLQFPVSLLALILAYAKLKRVVKEARTKKADTQPKAESSVVERLEDMEVFNASIMLLGTLLGVFYLLVTFARPGLFAQNQVWLFLFFFLIIFGLTGIRELERHVDFKTKEAKRKFGHITRMICLGLSWIMAFIIFWETIPVVWTMLFEGGYLCYGFIGLLGYIIHRLARRFSEIKDGGYRNSASIIAIAVGGAIYYLAVLAFASRVYPFIPVIKGGGDYTTEKKAVISFAPQYSNSIPSQIINTSQPPLKSLPVTIIEESPTALILTTNDPSLWHKPGQTNKPNIVTIKKDAVISVELSK